MSPNSKSYVEHDFIQADIFQKCQLTQNRI